MQCCCLFLFATQTQWPMCRNTGHGFACSPHGQCANAPICKSSFVFHSMAKVPMYKLSFYTVFHNTANVPMYSFSFYIFPQHSQCAHVQFCCSGCSPHGQGANVQIPTCTPWPMSQRKGSCFRLFIPWPMHPSTRFLMIRTLKPACSSTCGFHHKVNAPMYR